MVLIVAVVLHHDLRRFARGALSDDARSDDARSDARSGDAPDGTRSEASLS
jgi:hypothetical protein